MKRISVLVATVLALVLVPPPGASAAAPDAVAWWNALHREGAPQPPAPGVDPGELLVQGGDPLSLLPGLTAQPSPLAVAALRFTLGPDALVTDLALAVDGPAVAQDVRAYTAAGPFEPVENGPYEKAPDVVLDDVSKAVLSADGLTLSFPDISRLVSPEGVLSIVLIAGPGDRVVLKAPGPAALDVVEPSGSMPEQPGPVAESPPLALDSGGSVSYPPPAGSPSTSSAFAPVAPPAAASAPDVTAAPQVAAPTSVAPMARRAVSTPINDTRTRVLVLVEAILVGIFFGLLGYGPFAQLSRITGLVTTPRGASRVLGIGRFSSVRTGSAPQL